MSDEQPKIGGQWKPGQSGNPKGRPRLPEDVKEIREVAKFELERMLQKFSTMTYSDMLKFGANRDQPAMEHCLVSLFLKCILYGDARRMELLMNRRYGVLKTQIQVLDENDRPVDPSRSSEARRAEIKRLQEILNVLDPDKSP